MALSTRFRVILGFALLLIAVQAVNMLSGYSLVQHGILPRHLWGLQGLVFAPLLHGSLAHLLSNLVPFLVLSWLVATEGVKRYVWVVVLVCLLGGALVWLFGRSSLHVGASGLIFGLWTYLLARGWYQRSFASLLMAIVALAAYSGMVFGFVPVPGVSFESHIAGAVAGIVVARLMHAKAVTPGAT